MGIQAPAILGRIFYSCSVFRSSGRLAGGLDSAIFLYEAGLLLLDRWRSVGLRICRPLPYLFIRAVLGLLAGCSGCRVQTQVSCGARIWKDRAVRIGLAVRAGSSHPRDFARRRAHLIMKTLGCWDSAGALGLLHPPMHPRPPTRPLLTTACLFLKNEKYDSNGRSSIQKGLRGRL